MTAVSDSRSCLIVTCVGADRRDHLVLDDDVNPHEMAGCTLIGLRALCGHRVFPERDPTRRIGIKCPGCLAMAALFDPPLKVRGKPPKPHGISPVHQRPRVPADAESVDCLTGITWPWRAADERCACLLTVERPPGYVPSWSIDDPIPDRVRALVRWGEDPELCRAVRTAGGWVECGKATGVAWQFAVDLTSFARCWADRTHALVEVRLDRARWEVAGTVRLNYKVTDPSGAPLLTGSKPTNVADVTGPENLIALARMLGERTSSGPDEARNRLTAWVTNELRP